MSQASPGLLAEPRESRAPGEIGAVNLSDPRRLREIAEALTRLFYCLLAVALLAAVFGSPGSGFLLLILAGFAHVARVGADGLAGTALRR